MSFTPLLGALIIWLMMKDLLKRDWYSWRKPNLPSGGCYWFVNLDVPTSKKVMKLGELADIIGITNAITFHSQNEARLRLFAFSTLNAICRSPWLPARRHPTNLQMMKNKTPVQLIPFSWGGVLLFYSIICVSASFLYQWADFFGYFVPGFQIT